MERTVSFLDWSGDRYRSSPPNFLTRTFQRKNTENDVRTPIISCLALLVATSGLTAQGESQDELKQLYHAKVKAAWVTGGGWSTDFAAAKARAKQENKLVFAYFTRSYSP